MSEQPQEVIAVGYVVEDEKDTPAAAVEGSPLSQTQSSTNRSISDHNELTKSFIEQNRSQASHFEKLADRQWNQIGKLEQKISDLKAKLKVSVANHAEQLEWGRAQLTEQLEKMQAEHESVLSKKDEKIARLRN